MKLYSKDGVELTDNDVYFLRQNDIVYLDLIGTEFNSAQILDQFYKSAQLGLSGNVFQLVNKENGQFTVVKTVHINESYDQKRIDEFIRQLDVLKLTENNNIVKLNHVFPLGGEV
jgi:hypothetical protein